MKRRYQKKENPQNQGGRPRLEISQQEFEKLCGIQCTLIEIISWFRCSDKTLEQWCHDTYGKGFSEVFKEKRSDGLRSLRRKQFEVAMSGDKTMLIWLGKQYLGQAEKQVIDQKSVNVNANAEIESSQVEEVVSVLKAIIDTKINERKG